MYNSELPRRGVLIEPSGRVHELPEYALDDEELGWPLTMPVIQPGQPTPMMELYRRHEIRPGRYIFIKRAEQLKEIPRDMLDRLVR
jgi:hypothetical protein